ncbi:MAG: MBL fold metallo-hydrolase [Phycisphaerae bacterium]|nr:MBL fold metallo-hydrolase [Phycisphaerae bacterium]
MSAFSFGLIGLILSGLCQISLGSAETDRETLGKKETEKMFETDIIQTTSGDLTITFIGHGTLMFQWAGKTIHIDPWTNLADYTKLPAADIILITHEHGDHLDTKAIEQIRQKTTIVIVSASCADKVPNATVMKNGDKQVLEGFTVEAVPAYNIVHQRSNGTPFHPKGRGNGYVVTFADKRIYIAADTENIPEMADLKNIDIAFLPMNLPYTMTPEMVADAAKSFKPKILYPYHYGDTDTSKLTELLKNEKEIEIRIRKMQ